MKHSSYSLIMIVGKDVMFNDIYQLCHASPHDND